MWINLWNWWVAMLTSSRVSIIASINNHDAIHQNQTRKWSKDQETQSKRWVTPWYSLINSSWTQQVAWINRVSAAIRLWLSTKWSVRSKGGGTTRASRTSGKATSNATYSARSRVSSATRTSRYLMRSSRASTRSRKGRRSGIILYFSMPSRRMGNWPR